LSNAGPPLLFTKRNRCIPQPVTDTAVADAVADGTRFIQIQLSTIEGDDAGARLDISTSGSTTSISTNAVRGTFTLTANDETTNLVAFNADAATLQSKLQTISSIAGHVTVTGSG